jgi:hypothetical protein
LAAASKRSFVTPTTTDGGATSELATAGGATAGGVTEDRADLLPFFDAAAEEDSDDADPGTSSLTTPVFKIVFSVCLLQPGKTTVASPAISNIATLMGRRSAEPHRFTNAILGVPKKKDFPTLWIVIGFLCMLS